MSGEGAVVDLLSTTPQTKELACPLACRHCGAELTAPSRDGFCCTGCRVVHGLLSARGLTRYYDLRAGETLTPAHTPASTRDLKWLDAIETDLRGAEGPRRVGFDLQGIQCAACVWLIDELFERVEPASSRLSCTVNPALGRVEVMVTREFPLRDWITEVERFGYLLGPERKVEAARSSDLLWRIGVCAAIAMNAMLFTIPVNLGLREGAVYHVFRWAGMLLAGVSVMVGGSVFIRSAWQCLRRGVLHMDVPIALGIVLAYGGSVWHFALGRDQGAFFDTVATFIVLMLTGRWLQERVVERNRAMLLASDGVDSLLARRVREGHVEVVPCRDLVAGDTVLVASGDLVPMAAALDDESASCSLDWINGESAPRAFARGEVIPAGAFNLGVSAITLRATEDFSRSVLPSLLRSTRDDSHDAARATSWWQRLTRTYVVAVLGLATLCFAYWTFLRHDVTMALQATTALLVVTCPCAYGIATPTAYELVQSGLRRAGMYIRSASLLDRLPDVRRVVFDKTGTLTEGVLELVAPERLATLADDDRDALYNIVVRSTHPKSVAVRRAFEASSLLRAWAADRDVRETPGSGLSLSHDGITWRLGRAAWAAPGEGADHDDLVFAREGRVVAVLPTAEVVRPDAKREIENLTRAGLDVWMLSGDEPGRVAEMAASLGIADDHAVGGASPEGKAAWVSAHDRRDTFMIGDGINDGLAVERAFCSATPAADRPFMPARTDAWFVSPGLRPVRLALRASRALVAVNRRNLAVATAYNVGAVALSFAGLMSPILCATLMPLTSLSIILATIASLSPRRALWRS